MKQEGARSGLSLGKDYEVERKSLRDGARSGVVELTKSRTPGRQEGR